MNGHNVVLYTGTDVREWYFTVSARRRGRLEGRGQLGEIPRGRRATDRTLD